MPSQQPVVIHLGPEQNTCRAAAPAGLDIVAYVRDGGPVAGDGHPVIAFIDWQKRLIGVPSLVAALDPAARRALVEKITAAGGTFATVPHPGRAVAPSVTFGEGTAIGRGPIFIGSFTTIGRHTIVMTPASIGHDCIIGDFATIHPSASVSGHVVIEDDAEVGSGAVIVNGNAASPIRIGRGARIDVGAVVMTRTVPAGTTVAGNPGRRQRANGYHH
jgi:acetyltransferase-like isoleucine patch superfamily enzyme